MKLKYTKDGVGLVHGYVKQQQDVLTIVEVGGFNLEQVRRMGYKELTLVDLRLELSTIKQILQSGSIEKIDS